MKLSNWLGGGGDRRAAHMLAAGWTELVVLPRARVLDARDMAKVVGGDNTCTTGTLKVPRRETDGSATPPLRLAATLCATVAATPYGLRRRVSRTATGGVILNPETRWPQFKSVCPKSNKVTQTTRALSLGHPHHLAEIFFRADANGARGAWGLIYAHLPTK